MPVSLYMHSVLCVLLMGERDIIMQHAFYRLDLNDVADWVRSPLLRICSQYNIAPIDDTQLLDLAELLVDYDINSRLSWTGHNSSYRLEEFCEFFGPAYRYNDEFYCEFDELRCVVGDYLERRLQPFMGKMWRNPHIYELRRLHGWLVLIDLGVAKKSELKIESPQPYEAVERRGGLEIRRYSAGQVVIMLVGSRPASERKKEIVPMGNIKMQYRPPENHVIRPPEDLTDEQFEWLAEVERLRAECSKKYPAPATTARNLRAGQAYQRKRSMLRSKLGPIRSEKNDLYFNPHRDGYTFVSADQLDDGEVRQASEHHTPTLRPVRRQRRPSRRPTSQRSERTDA